MRALTGIICLLLLVASLASARGVVAEAPITSDRSKPVEGDGLRFGATVIRLHGIDAPEIGQKFSCASGPE